MQNWKELLRESGIAVGPEVEASLQRYTELIREWNPAVSLVSQGDLDRLETSHIVDSLSLAPYVRAACGSGGLLLDVGSGAGFPAIPIKLVLPEIQLVMVERSERKAGFIRTVLGVLKLKGADVRSTEFPRGVAGFTPEAVTARAVERPDKVIKEISRFLPPKGVFLCQLGDPRNELRGMFHVEHIRDAWTDAGLRRGQLFVVSHPS